MKKDKDGYGALLLSALKSGGLGVFEIAEREDGFIAASSWPPRYFAEHLHGQSVNGRQCRL